MNIMAIQTVTNRKGHRELFDMQKVDEVLMSAARGYEHFLNKQEIYRDLEHNLYEGMPTSEINKTLIMVLTSRIELVPEYSNISANVLLSDLASDILGVSVINTDYIGAYKSNLEKQVRMGVEAGRLDPRILMFDFKMLSEAIDPKRDTLFDYLGAKTLYDRYFLRDHSQEILELPQYFWMRVAMGLAIEEKDRNQKAMEFYEIMSTLRYVPSTPTLFHSGTTHPQMSSCYLTTVTDDLEDIFKAFADNAQLSKWSGGIGNDWSYIRGTGAHIKSTNVSSQGVIPFLKIADTTTAAINRSGKRRGATCVYLETWHYDLEDFIELRKNTGDERRRTHDTNTANWIPDLFMKRVIENGQWTLFSPDETPDLHDLYGKAFEERYVQYEQMADRGEIALWKRMPAADLWRKMLTMLFSTGHPWITFKDPSNIRSPQDHVGVVHSSNLCTEITLNTSRDEVAVCNLGSINLQTHVENGRIAYHLVEKTVKTAMRMLDNVVDLNFYPIPEARNSNLKHRPVGLGLMGWHDVLYKMNLRFDSDEAVQLADELMEFVSYNAILGSAYLAKEKGAYSTFKGSKWDRNLLPFDTIALLEKERGMEIDVPKTMKLDWAPVREAIKKYGMRNSNCMAIAPTATISNIAGSVPTVEPIYKNMYVKSNQTGEFTVVNPYLVEALREINSWTPEMVSKIKRADGSVQEIEEIPLDIRARFQEVFEIDPVWIIKHAARRTKWIDQSQSINMFARSVSGKFFSDLYMEAWKQGLKTTYYLRTLGASQVDRATLDNDVKSDKAEVVEPLETAAQSQVTSFAPQSTATPVASMSGEMHQSPVAPPMPQYVVPTIAQPVHQEVYVQNQVVNHPPVQQNYQYAAQSQYAQIPVQTVVPQGVQPNPVFPIVQPNNPVPMTGAVPSAPQMAPNAVVNEVAGGPKLCRLDDPTCESCQ
jgi:ribonucleoside-diphosphate reductase alpha chain